MLNFINVTGLRLKTADVDAGPIADRPPDGVPLRPQIEPCACLDDDGGGLAPDGVLGRQAYSAAGVDTVAPRIVYERQLLRCSPPARVGKKQ
jgi:hypothetical protein